MAMVAIGRRRRWRRMLFAWAPAIALALSLATACSSPTGPPDVSPPDESETDKGEPPGPGDKQGFLVVPRGTQGLLV